jgi:hypothetical protein
VNEHRGPYRSRDFFDEAITTSLPQHREFVPPIIEIIKFDKYQPAIMSQGLVTPGDVLVGNLFRWDPSTEDRTDHLAIYSSDEIFVGRDGNHW